MLEQVDKNNIPQHIAIVMDGNGRWAKKRGLQRIMGHRNGVKAVREAAEIATELGVKYLTLYAFSTENWMRPQSEIDSLMSLLVNAIEDEEPTLLKNNIRLSSIGDLNALPKEVANKFNKVVQNTSKNTGLVLIIALSYSGRWEIADAAKRMCEDAVAGKLKIEEVNENCLSNYLQSSDTPDPDLFIRTGGDLRVSNFLLWEIAYTEFYFLDTLWPDFRKQHFIEAVLDFQKRERRFGKVLNQ